MRRLCIACIAAVSALGLVHVASAADMPTKGPVFTAAKASPTYNWGGFYAGAHFGYLWSSTQVEDTGVVVEPNAATNGVVGGVLAGYNYQMGEVVVGLEGDFGWSNAHGTGVVAVAVAIFPPNQYDLDWTGHVRGRLGYAPSQGPWLLYVAGGLALSRFTFTDSETMDKTSATYTGGSFGGGVEYGFTNLITGRVEFLYDNYRISSSLIMLNDYTAKLQNASTARGAITFKF
jgi:outer membrane immunogenic protein